MKARTKEARACQGSHADADADTDADVDVDVDTSQAKFWV